VDRQAFKGKEARHEEKLTFRVSSDLYTVTGMVNQNSAPILIFEVKPIAPPINLTNCLEIDNPRPVPPKRRVDELSACWNGTNNRSASLCFKPMPVSLHEQTISLSQPKCDAVRPYEEFERYFVSHVHRILQPADNLN
jgi:hypothetical protein